MIFVRQGAPQQRPEPVFLGTVQPIKPLSIVVAVDNAGGFGKDGNIPWHIPEDFKHFKEITKVGICIMGRKTYEDTLAIVKKRQKKKRTVEELLPGRDCYVLTRQKDYEAEGAKVAGSLMEAVQDIDENNNRTVFVIGGEKLFIEALPYVNTIHLTQVDGYYNCDRFFPIGPLMEKFTPETGTHGKNKKLRFIEYKRTSK
jgi:dihydrofolate reductase